jgi:hypothetical protein
MRQLPTLADGLPAIPSYDAAADFLAKKNGSGLRLLGWTIARALLIAPPFMIIGVPPKKAVAGSLLASSAISIFVLMRIKRAADEAAGIARAAATTTPNP